MRIPECQTAEAHVHGSGEVLAGGSRSRIRIARHDRIEDRLVLVYALVQTIRQAHRLLGPQLSTNLEVLEEAFENRVTTQMPDSTVQVVRRRKHGTVVGPHRRLLQSFHGEREGGPVLLGEPLCREPDGHAFQHGTNRIRVLYLLRGERLDNKHSTGARPGEEVLGM